MDKSIRDTAIKGTLWSFIERISVQIVQFAITIVMARMLAPSDYGLIGILTVFISLSQVFIDGGFSSALIQRKDVSQLDYTTVFYVNVSISLAFYLLLYVCAPLISDFYDQQILTIILRVYALTLIINALAAVQKTILTIQIDFKTQSKISLSSAFISGIIGIALACKGYGVWSLVVQSLAQSVVNVFFTILLVKWKPLPTFSTESFRKLFGFGSKLLVASIISSVYDNLYSVVIGKTFSSADLGYYQRSRQFPELVSINISSILSRITYPIFCRIQDDDERLLSIYKKYIQYSSFIIFPLLATLAGLAKPIVLFLLTDKWIDTAPLIQILSLGLMWNCITQVNLSLLKVKGRSDLVLKLEIVKKVIAVVILFVSLMFNSITIVCWGIALYSTIAVGINTYYTNRLFGYGIVPQVKDFCIYLLLSAIIFVEGLVVVAWVQNVPASLAIGIVLLPLTYIGGSSLCQVEAIKELKVLIDDIRGKRL